MDRAFTIRALSLYVPLFSALIFWKWRGPAAREATGALLSSAWNVPAVLALNLLAIRLGWWSFNARGAAFLGVPADLWLGWSALWGCVAALLFRRTPVWLACCCLALLDVIVMPLCAPVLLLGRFWLAGEIVGLAFCLAPALYFARWTRDAVHVTWRATLQFLTFSGIFLIGIVISQTASHHNVSFNLRSISAQMVLQLVFTLALPGLSAVQEFATAGRGTPLPYDPPNRLVTSGIYAYIANPMQTSTTALLFALGLALRSLWLVLAGLIAAIYCAGLAAWDEDEDLKARFGAALTHYRLHVRNWIPRWRPFIASPGRIYLSEECFKCSQMASFLLDLKPTNLRILPAEEHPFRDLERMTYESGDGAIQAEGVAALARALEHVNLAWAFAGMALRLPLVSHLVQAIVDAGGGGPMRVARRACSIAPPQQGNF